MNKLAELNKLKVVEYDIANNEVQYIAVENNEKNRNVLRGLGATEEDIEYMVDKAEADTLEIAEFAFFKLKANWWSLKEGFGYNN